ncbi:hypothetical protein M5E89_02270 [Acidaminococcus intestini]|nr:hypothetical protein M5E89_02270 [Acidaminococcus intestini]
MAKARKKLDWEAQMELAIDPQKPVPSAMPRTRVRMNTAPCAEITVLSRSLANTLTIRKRKTLKSIGKRPISTLLPFPKTSKGLAEHFLFGKPFS